MRSPRRSPADQVSHFLYSGANFSGYLKFVQYALAQFSCSDFIVLPRLWKNIRKTLLGLSWFEFLPIKYEIISALCKAILYDDGPTLNQHWVNVLCLRGEGGGGCVTCVSLLGCASNSQLEKCDILIIISAPMAECHCFYCFGFPES